MTTVEGQARIEQVAASMRVLTRDHAQTRATAGEALRLAEGAQRAIVRLGEIRHRQPEAPAVPVPEVDDRPAPPLSWLTISDPAEARAAMADLVDWLGAVYVQYPDAHLAPCWAWHPSVVAELLACRAMWVEAYEGADASALRVADWHDRWRLGAMRRVNAALRDCSLDRHQVDGPLSYRPPQVPAVDQVDELATWWADTRGATRAPAPSAALVATVDAQRVEDY